MSLFCIYITLFVLIKSWINLVITTADHLIFPYQLETFCFSYRVLQGHQLARAPRLVSSRLVPPLPQTLTSLMYRVYCEYNYASEQPFTTPEEQVIHFLSRTRRPGWKWMSLRPRSPLKDKEPGKLH